VFGSCFRARRCNDDTPCDKRVRCEQSDCLNDSFVSRKISFGRKCESSQMSNPVALLTSAPDPRARQDQRCVQSEHPVLIKSNTRKVRRYFFPNRARFAPDVVQTRIGASPTSTPSSLERYDSSRKAILHQKEKLCSASHVAA